MVSEITLSIETRTIAKTGIHSYGEWVVVNDSTCSSEGLEERRCTRCGEVLESKTIAKKDHSYGEWTVDKEPTCTETGSKHRTCNNCGAEEKEDIDALGHDYHSWGEEATCTKDGFIVDVCSRCGDQQNYQVLPATGHHYSDWAVDKEATTDSEGLKSRTCSICGEKETEIIPKLEKKKNNLGVIILS